MLPACRQDDNRHPGTLGFTRGIGATQYRGIATWQARTLGLLRLPTLCYMDRRSGRQPCPTGPTEALKRGAGNRTAMVALRRESDCSIVERTRQDLRHSANTVDLTADRKVIARGTTRLREEQVICCSLSLAQCIRRHCPSCNW